MLKTRNASLRRYAFSEALFQIDGLANICWVLRSYWRNEAGCPQSFEDTPVVSIDAGGIRKSIR